ncbi:ferredoxin [Bacteroidia bacterium]|nr:ferredoxin [Bacteroidia bacterium]
MAKGTVEIDTARCKGCELCVVACPTDVLALGKEVNGKGYHFATMVKPDECIGCASCGYVCPDACITVYKQK